MKVPQLKQKYFCYIAFFNIAEVWKRKMTLLDRYILRAHIAPFLFGFTLVVFLFLFQFMLNHLDKLVGKGLDTWVIVQLVSLNMAWMVVLAVPMGILFSTLFSFGQLSAANEITVIKASGGSLVRMIAPVVIAGCLFTYGLFWFNNVVLPESNHRAKTLLGDIQRMKPTFSIEPGQFSTDLEGYTILARAVDSSSGLLRGVTIYDHTKIGRVNIASADTGIVNFAANYSKLIVTLFNGEVHQITTTDIDNYRIVNFEKYEIAMNASGFDFSRTEKEMISRGDREMRIEDMRIIAKEADKNRIAAAERIAAAIENHCDYLLGTQNDAPQKDHPGYSFTPVPQYRDTSRRAALNETLKRISFLRSSVNSDIFQYGEYSYQKRQYEVEIHKKYAIPFACLLFVFVGAPLGIITRGGNFGLSAAICLAFYIFYWACLIGGEKLADRGYLTPIVSMWFGNVMLGLLGMILTAIVNNESLKMPKFLFIGKLFTSRKSHAISQ